MYSGPYGVALREHGNIKIRNRRSKVFARHSKENIKKGSGYKTNG